MKRCLSILAFGLLLLTSCLNELQGDREEASGASNVVLNIATKPQTKLGTASDGDVMKNLHIWLVYGTTVKGYLCQDDAECTISGTGSTATATFKNIPRGACTLYLVANLPVDSTLPDAFGVGSTITDDFLKYVLPAVDENTHEPPYGDTTPGMPLSTTLNMSVGAGTNRVSAELVRCCAKITLTIRNNTLNNSIMLTDLTLSPKNPKYGYLFRQDDYSIPYPDDLLEFKSKKVEGLGATTDIVLGHGETISYIEQYLYETEPGMATDLGFSIAGGLYAGEGVSSGEIKQVETGTGVTKTVYEANQVTSISNSGQFLIRSRYEDSSGNGYFIYNNNGTLAVSSATSLSDILGLDNSERNKYLWTFSSSGTSGKTTIKSVSNTSQSFYYSWFSNSFILSSYSSSSFSFLGSNGEFRFSYVQGNTYYTINISSGGISVDNASKAHADNDNNYLYLYNVTSKEVTIPSTENKLVDNNGNPASVYFDKTIPSLNYINKYGIPVPLEQIRRNQDVQIVVNIHYNPNSGVLFFETSDWVDDKNETTFD